jgi:beta-1,4-N-acetylglucosaminyltransferase
MKKVIFASSSGGHLEELMKFKTIFNSYDYLIVTEDTKTTQDLQLNYNVKYLAYGSRQYLFKYVFIFIYNVLKSLFLILSYKPDVVVTTGAHTGGIVAFIAKLFKKKVIYIETFARVNTLSLTGKFMYNISDKFYVQWEELTKIYNKAEFIGRLM